ncbi:MAG: peptide chain release factor N(5)-glutamine methyltransferase [Myxococcota bacterium]
MTLAMARDEWTIKGILSWTANYFTERGISSPRFSSEILLASCLGCERIYLYTHFDEPVKEEARAKMREFVKRRIGGEPLQHIVGFAYFWSHKIAVDRRVMIPRPETEHLIEVIVGEYNGSRDEAFSMLEIGVGSGCAAIALASEFKRASITGVDISDGALAVARANIASAGFEGRIKTVKSDLFSAIGDDDKFDVIYSNPPYIPTGEIERLSVEVREYDPREALDGGDDGLNIILRLVSGSSSYLKPNGLLALEIGDGQAEAVRKILVETGFGNIKIKPDLRGIPRIAYGYLI